LGFTIFFGYPPPPPPINFSMPEPIFRSHITTDGQSASSSWHLAPFGASDQMLHLFEWQLLSLFLMTRGRVRNLQCNDASSISSCIVTDGLSASSSWCRASNRAHNQILISLFDSYFVFSAYGSLTHFRELCMYIMAPQPTSTINNTLLKSLPPYYCYSAGLWKRYHSNEYVGKHSGIVGHIIFNVSCVIWEESRWLVQHLVE
jgi:hypothetical protein